MPVPPILGIAVGVSESEILPLFVVAVVLAFLATVAARARDAGSAPTPESAER